MTQTSRHLLPTNDDVVYVVDKVEGSKIGRGCGIKERPKASVESAPGRPAVASSHRSSLEAKMDRGHMGCRDHHDGVNSSIGCMCNARNSSDGFEGC